MVNTTELNLPGYQLQQPLAGGGMSQVFLAIEEATDRPVVVKTAPPAADERTRQRLSKEHRLLSAVDHPNVAQVLDCGFAQERPFLVLDFITGPSLRDLMTRGKPMNWDQAASIIEQLSGALSALHAQAIIHRDVKPENVLLDEHQRVTLIDLSIGTEISELGALTSHDQILGTVDYMAPEQRHRLQVDARTDEYSLAAMAFEMLTGYCPLGQFRRPSELNPDLPASVDEVLLTALERDPDDRFPTVEAFTDALKVALQQGRKRGRASGRLLGAAVFLFALIVFGIVYSGRFHPASEMEQSPRPAKTASQVDVRSSGSQQEITNTLGMKFVRIPAGSFQMGATAAEINEVFAGRISRHALHESPKRSVTLTRSLWMGTHEVTVGQFRRFIEETGYQTTSEKWVAEQGRKPKQPIWNDPAHFVAHENMPVCAVSWEDAVRFCRWLSKREHASYRLPTEAEWEYACRATSTGPWFCEREELPTCAVYSRHWEAGPLPVGQCKPNAWGLHDMHGNVWEWCQDYYSTSYHADASETDPIWSQPAAANDFHVLRGGGYKAAPAAIRSAIRRGHNNDEAHCDRGHAIGFRVVCETFANRIAKRSQ